MCGVRRPAGELRRRNNQNEGGRGNSWKAERIRRGADEDLRRDSAPGFVLVIGDRTRTVHNRRVVIVVAGQMRMQRLTVMMLGLIGIEMHVQERRTERARLHQHGESGRGQPAEHRAIVVKDERAGT